MLSPEHLDWSFSLLDTCFEAGITTFDTAHVYQDGDSQRVLGKWIRARGIQNEVVIINKAGHASSNDLTRELHQALERLQVDVIDLFMIHRDYPQLSPEALIPIFSDFQNAGYIRAYGVSNWAHERIQGANDHAHQHHLKPIAASSVQFSLAQWHTPPWEESLTLTDEAYKWYQQTQMPLFAWSSLAGGFLSGRFRPDNLHTFTEYFDRITARTYGSEANFARLERAEALARKKHLTLPQISLAYVLSQPMNIHAIIGCRTVAEVQDCTQALTIPLTSDERIWLKGD